jgi:hypothetical protein
MFGRRVVLVKSYRENIEDRRSGRSTSMLNMTEVKVRAMEHTRRIDNVNHDGWLTTPSPTDQRTTARTGVFSTFIALLRRNQSPRKEGGYADGFGSAADTCSQGVA